MHGNSKRTLRPGKISFASLTESPLRSSLQWELLIVPRFLLMTKALTVSNAQSFNSATPSPTGSSVSYTNITVPSVGFFFYEM